MTDVRANLKRLIQDNSDDYVSLSRMLGRNAAYIQQFLQRGTPRKLDEADRKKLARYFGCDEALLGGDDPKDKGPAIAFVPQLDVGASAGPGSLVEGEAARAHVGFETSYLRTLVSNPGNLNIIRVKGESMSPTLLDGDEIMVDLSELHRKLRNGLYVIRLDGAVMVKRLLVRSGKDAVTIKSDNADYPTLIDQDPSDFDVIGRVVWVGRKLV